MKRIDFSKLIVYQIYPRSFQDSNGDGVGDLKGVLQRLDHLQELGVNAVWLCPCYPSPQKDNGYDISDYLSIHPEYGSFADWERLRDSLHERGMYLIMDLVVNHTSDRHPWFQAASASKDSPYRDYYIWAKTPPNHWKSCFGGSAWKFHSQTGEYYLHSFAESQPDLNWENPRVRAEIRAVVDFWTERGVDGFRCDVIDFIAKDLTSNKMHGGLFLRAYLKELFHRPKTAHLFTVGESQATKESVSQLCGKDSQALTTVFQFDHVRLGQSKKDKFLPAAATLDDVKKQLVKWQALAEELQFPYTLFTDNHDQAPFISRLGKDEKYRYECATLVAAAFYLLKGIPFIFQGQEYGFASPRYEDVRDFQDVESLQYYEKHKSRKRERELLDALNFGSRDNARRPMAWTDTSVNAHGFTTGTPWISIHSRAEEINLERDKKAEKSVFAFYQKLLAFRKKRACIREGSFRDLSKNGKGYFLYERYLGKESVLVFCNFERAQDVPLPPTLTAEYRLALSNYPDCEPFSSHFQIYEVRVYEKRK